MREDNIRVKPLISIIVPIYNVETYLTKCILSIIQQTYKNIQIILVDDGSTDNCGKICDNFAETDHRIEVIHKTNGGLVSARKAGLDVARGQYIGFVDGDDYIDEYMYKRLLENLVDTGADFVHSGHYQNRIVISQLESKVIDISRNKGIFINQYILSDQNKEFISFAIWSKLFKADFIKKCYSEVPNVQSLGEDLVCLIICMLQGSKMSILNESHYYHIIRKKSIIHAKNDRAILDLIRLYETIESILMKYDCYDMVKDLLIRDWLKKTALGSLIRTVNDEFAIQCYKINDMSMLFGKKIVLYGAGKVGRSYYSQICRYKQCKIVAWVDANYQNIHYDCANVSGEAALGTLDFDILIIALQYEKDAQQIKSGLITEYEIDAAKIKWIQPERI